MDKINKELRNIYLRKFKIIIEGKNCLISINGVKTKAGFYTTRFIEAHDESNAENLAMDLVKAEIGQFISEQKTYEPVITIVENVEVLSFENNNVPGQGLTWFREE